MCLDPRILSGTSQRKINAMSKLSQALGVAASFVNRVNDVLSSKAGGRCGPVRRS